MSEESSMDNIEKKVEDLEKRVSRIEKGLKSNVQSKSSKKSKKEKNENSKDDDSGDDVEVDTDHNYLKKTIDQAKKRYKSEHE